jgi:ubiquinone/menaquinone biosynthesis C-methylase UbiE
MTMTTPRGGASGSPEPGALYALGSNEDESTRLQRQAEELRPEAAALLGQIGLRPGQSAIDLGCGPAGILELLAAAVSPGGRVVGVDADPVHVTMAREHAAHRALAGTEVIEADARRTGLPTASFDLVHARTLLVTIPEPAEVLAEMVRLARPDGWVASQEPDAEHSICYPALPAWTRLHELFRTSFGRNGADPLIGRKLAELYREAGLRDVQVQARAPAHPAGHTRRTVLADLVRSLRPMIVELGLADERELTAVDQAVRAHLADPRTVVVPYLWFTVWGRKT